MASKGSQPKKVTINEVADRAGVAISSVSRVLSNHPTVSEKMRRKVEAVVAELGYEPDLLAQSFRKGSTGTVGFIIRDISNPIFSIIIQSAEVELRKAGYSMILVNSGGDIASEKENFLVLKRRRVEGVIAALVSEESPYIKEISNNFESPIVLIDREIKGLKVSSVIGDHKTGVEEATRRLLEMGHRKIAFVSGRKDIFVVRNRLAGYEAAYASFKMPVPKDLIKLGKFGEDFAYEMTYELFKKKGNRPTALITGGIAASTGALKAFKLLNISIPEDVEMVAIDEWPMFDLLTTDISSVYRDPKVLGEEVAKVLIQMLNGGKPVQVKLPTYFRDRTNGRWIKKKPSNSSKN